MDRSTSRMPRASRLFPFLNWLPLLDRHAMRADLAAGITAGVLILPQAIALAVLAGMPPEYGLYTSIFPVIIAALFGSSWHAMSGPNTALCILLAFAIAPYASPQTPEWVQYAITLSFMTAVVQLAFGFLGIGVVFNYFSHTVMVAIITGVGIVICLQQVGNFGGLQMNAGLPIEDGFRQVIFNFHNANPYVLSVGLITLATGLLVKRFRPKWPHLILAVIVGTLFAELLDMLLGASTTEIDRLGTLTLSTLPLSAPDFSVQHFAEAREGMFSAAFLAAFLGLMQSAVIARAMAVKSGQTVDVNQEVIGQGMANLAGSFLSCFPSCGSFNRSASNIESGARTPLSAIISAFVLTLLVFFASPLVRELPLAVMAAILFLVGIGLVKSSDILPIVRVHGESRIVFILTLITVLFGGLDKAVFLGIGLSVIVYLRGTSRPNIELLSGEEAALYFSGNVPSGTVVQISGSLYFGSLPVLERFISDLNTQDKGAGNLIISGEYIENLDATAADFLMREAFRRKRKGSRLALWLRDDKLQTVLDSSGLAKAIGKENIHFTRTI